VIFVAGVDGVAAADTNPDVVPATSPCCTAAARLPLVVAADAKFLLVASAKLTTTVATNITRLKRFSFPLNKQTGR